MSEGSAEDVLRKMFRVFDVNSDGTISKRELRRLVKDMYGLIKENNANDLDEEGISNKAFVEMDRDEDGQISMEEFIEACLKQEQFTKLLAMKAIGIFIET